MAVTTTQGGTPVAPMTGKSIFHVVLAVLSWAAALYALYLGVSGRVYPEASFFALMAIWLTMAPRF
jgi:hypothetical protein